MLETHSMYRENHSSLLKVKSAKSFAKGIAIILLLSACFIGGVGMYKLMTIILG